MPGTYRVDPAALFARVVSRPNPGIEDAMRQLIERYGLRNKNTLGVGSAVSLEEYWLWKAGCTLTLIDIDEHGGLEPWLKTLPPGDLTFIVGDAIAHFKPKTRLFGLIEEPAVKQFDLLYLGGYTPDVFWRNDIIRERQTWPANLGPFHSSVMHAARQLKDGGIFVNLCFGLGLDALYHKNFIPAAQHQLAREGIRLIDVHRMKETVGVNLFVGKVGSDKMELGRPLTRIHGRGPDEPAERIWP